MSSIVVFCGFVYAVYRGFGFDPLLLSLTLVGVLMLHAVGNWVNDYYDYARGVDRAGTGTVVYRPHPILGGIMSLDTLRNMILLLALGSIAIGLTLVLVFNRPLVLFLGLAGLLAGLIYSGPPYLKHRALGEPLVAVVFGPMIMVGSYYVASGVLSVETLVVSVPLGLLISAVLLANNIRDESTDREAGVKTLAVILGRKNTVNLYAGMIYVSYAVTALAVALRILPITSLATLVTISRAFRLVREMRINTPPDADPRTAEIVQLYGLTLLISLILGVILERCLPSLPTHSCSP
ncbi:MAG: prenyltransferase [Sulfolobales archaeon]